MSAEKEHHRAIVDSLSSLVWRTDSSGRHEYVGSAWLSFTGRTLEEVLEKGWLASVHPDDACACRVLLKEQLTRRESFDFEYRLRRHDGVYRHIVDRGIPYQDARDQFAGFVGFGVESADLYEQPEVEEFRVDDFFEMSLDHLCVASNDGYFKRLNQSWTRTLGWTTEELMARPSQEFVHPDDRDVTMAGRVLLHSGRELGELVNRYLCQDGSYRWFQWRSVLDHSRGLVYAAARDITEERQATENLRESKLAREQLERQLIVADRMGSLGTLVAGIAHEVNNPLTAVLANTSLMIESLEKLRPTLRQEDANEFLEQAADVQLGAEQIRKIVSGLKTFSQPESEQQAIVDVRTLLELSIDITNNEIRHRSRLSREFGEIPAVYVDESKLGWVFISILMNAAQALPEGHSEENEIRVSTSTDSRGRAVIEFRDTGPGISKDVMKRIFDPFFTTKPIGTGTGLGLSICHSIVTHMGGALLASSEVGKGASFKVVLPAATRTSESIASAEVPLERPRKRGTILIVDDEPSVGRALGRILRRYETTICTRAKQALELIRSGANYDVILSDLMMPEMSGMEFYEKLEQHDPELAARVIFISGGAFSPQASVFLERSTNTLVDKPFKPRALIELVERALI